MQKLKPATEILWAAAAALTPEENWTQGSLGRAADGFYADPNEPGAVSWCVLGAIEEAARAVCRNDDFRSEDQAHAALQKVIGEVDRCGEANFNNHVSHAEVLDALYKAAELS